MLAGLVRREMAKTYLCASLFLLMLSNACAEEAKRNEATASKRYSQVHVFNYGAFDKSCRGWTDGCRNCFYVEKIGNYCANNIGIACTPNDEIKCLQRAQER